MTTQKKLEQWLEILNEISVYLEMYIMNEEDKRRIHELDSVIDDIYNILNAMKNNNIGSDDE